MKLDHIHNMFSDISFKLLDIDNQRRHVSLLAFILYVAKKKISKALCCSDNGVL